MIRDNKNAFSMMVCILKKLKMKDYIKDHHTAISLVQSVVQKAFLFYT